MEMGTLREGRIIKTAHGHFAEDVWDGVNRSGIVPIGDKVLVRVDEALAKIGSIHLTNETHERQRMASTTGVLVAMGASAFTWNGSRTLRWEGDRPGLGSRVLFTRYAGQEYTGDDGRFYRVLDDVAIGAMRQSSEGDGA